MAHASFEEIKKMNHQPYSHTTGASPEFYKNSVLTMVASAGTLTVVPFMIQAIQCKPTSLSISACQKILFGIESAVTIIGFALLASLIIMLCYKRKNPHAVEQSTAETLSQAVFFTLPFLPVAALSITYYGLTQQYQSLKDMTTAALISAAATLFIPVCIHLAKCQRMNTLPKIFCLSIAALVIGGFYMGWIGMVQSNRLIEKIGTLCFGIPVYVYVCPDVRLFFGYLSKRASKG